MSTVLIIGGTGVLGKALSKYLRQKDFHVLQVGRNVQNDNDTLFLDVTDANQVDTIIKKTKPSVILHLAATFEDNFETALAINFMGAKNILAAISKFNYTTRVILAGSAAEYGLISPEENPIQENRVLRPVSIYGITKSWQTNWGLYWAHQGQDVIIARIFNLNAPGLSNRLFIGRVDQQIKEILAGKRKRIDIGSLANERDYVSLAEASQQLFAIMQHGKSGNIYHVASGIAKKIKDLLIEQLKSHNLTFNIVDEQPANTTHKGYDVPVIYADVSRTKKLVELSYG